MNRASLRPALLAVAVLLAVRPAWAAVPLKELTQEKLRDWVSAAVKASRDDPDRAGFWTDLDALIVVRPDRIYYEHDKGVPASLYWYCPPRRELDGEESRKAMKDLTKVLHYAIREHQGGLLSEEDARLVEIVSHITISSQGPPIVVAIPDERERLRHELAEARAEVERLRREAEPRHYVMVVQPSSMIYYDCASHCWLPGPASVVYYPAGSAPTPRRELPRPPEFVPPTPTPAPPTGLPRPEQPRPPLEKPLPPPQANEIDSEEAARVFWMGYRSYWQGDYDRALTSFDSAVRLDDEDARFWYYKALAERALGAPEKAEASAKRGRELHAARKPKADLVGAALERVQGQERRFLNAPEVVVSDAEGDR